MILLRPKGALELREQPAQEKDLQNRLNTGERMAIRLMEAVPAACEESNTENRASGFKTEAVSAPHGEAEVSLKADAEAATAGRTLVM